ncbi:glutaredoxin family protein [Metabacillus sp. 84]|uniref:glutaredoxin family protein n=1 Tax=unclassified Metabacillus TaxID=2675274 RepID=UPI003CF02403
MIDLILYSKKGCHLCEEAAALLNEMKNEWDLSFTVIDIGSDDGLTEKYGLMIPVIEYSGIELAYGRIKKDFLSKRIHEHVSIE